MQKLNDHNSDAPNTVYALRKLTFVYELCALKVMDICDRRIRNSLEKLGDRARELCTHTHTRGEHVSLL